MSAVAKMSVPQLVAEFQKHFSPEVCLELVEALTSSVRASLSGSTPVKPSVATKGKAKKADSDGEEKAKRPPTEWSTFTSKVLPILKAVEGHQHRFWLKFCGALKAEAPEDYSSLDDEEIADSYASWLEKHKDDASTASAGSKKSKSSGGRRSLTDEEKEERTKKMAAKRVEKAGGDPLAGMKVVQLTELYYQLSGKPAKKGPPKDFPKRDVLLAEVRRLKAENGEAESESEEETDDLLDEMDRVLAA
jgi:hypothetical protein